MLSKVITTLLLNCLSWICVPLNIASVSTERYFFTNQVMPDGSKIKWRRNDRLDSTTTTTYEPLPIAATGFERTTKGQIPTPELTVSNIFGTFSETIEDLDDLNRGKTGSPKNFVQISEGSAKLKTFKVISY